MKSLVTTAAALLCAATPAWAVTVTSGMTLSGSLETIWSSDLGARYSQSIHPVGGAGQGSTSPVTPDNYQFAGEELTVSLADRGISGTMTAITPPAVAVDGQSYHLNVVLTTPAVGYYGLGMGAGLDGNIYLGAGAGSSNQLYYGLRVSESTTGGADGGTSGNIHSLYAYFNGSWSENTDKTGFSDTSFGTTTVKRWSGGSVVDSSDGNGFVGLSFEPVALHASGGTGPGQTTTFDLWLTLSSTPVTVIPGVPEPGTWAMLLAGGALVGWAARRRRVV
jgi:hypothetical protein